MTSPVALDERREPLVAMQGYGRPPANEGAPVYSGDSNKHAPLKISGCNQCRTEKAKTNQVPSEITSRGRVNTRYRHKIMVQAWLRCEGVLQFVL